jgi:F0F1-type ATP synthase assembly protein I
VGEVQEKKLRVSFLPALQAATGGKSTINVAAPATTTAVDAADSGTTAAQNKMYAAANPSSTGGTTGSAPNTQSSKAAAAPTAATAGGQSVSAAVPSKKFEQALKDKEDEIKRLQALAKQYKQAAAKSSSSKFVGSLVLVAVIGVLLAYLTGHYSNNSSFLAIVGTLIAFVIGKYSSAKH